MFVANDCPRMDLDGGERQKMNGNPLREIKFSKQISHGEKESQEEEDGRDTCLDDDRLLLFDKSYSSYAIARLEFE